MGMQCFQPGKVATKKVQAVKKEERPALENANVIEERPGVFVWAHGNGSDELTPQEMAAIKKSTGYKSVDVVRATNIKRMMRTRTYTQIVKHYAGKKRYSARTIWAIYSALQSVGDGYK